MPNRFFTFGCCTLLPLAAMAQQRPNIIYIMSDQQAATDMSCAGNNDVKTPNMDRLAERGMRFTNAYCGSVEKYCGCFFCFIVFCIFAL